MTGLVERLRDESDLCRNDGADDIALLLDEAATELERLQAGYRRLLAATDVEMGDGDLAREVAAQALAPSTAAQR